MIRLSAAWRKISVSRTTGTARRVDDVGEHLARADRRQLVDVADQDQRGVIGHRPQNGVHQWHVDHRRLVDHEQVARQRLLPIPLEAARPRIDLEQTVDGLRLAASALAEPLGCTSGRRRQRDLDALGAEHLEDRVDQRGLADTRAAGDDQDLREQSQPERCALALGERDAGSGLDPWDGLRRIDAEARETRPPEGSGDDPRWLVRPDASRPGRCSAGRRPRPRSHRRPPAPGPTLPGRSRPGSPGAARPSAPAHRAAARSGHRPWPRSA